MLRQVCLFSFLLGVAIAAKPANRYVDSVLESNLERELLSANLLPARLPDFSVHLNANSKHKEIIDVNFTFGNITGLDRIKRKGDCSGPRTYKRSVTINCTLSLLPSQSAHRMVLSNSSYNHVGTSRANFTEILIDVKIISSPQGSQGVLKDFEFRELPHLTPKFSKIPKEVEGEDVEHLVLAYNNHVMMEFGMILDQNYADALRNAFVGVPMPKDK